MHIKMLNHEAHSQQNRIAIDVVIRQGLGRHGTRC